MRNEKSPILALVDCNNFFVSCERLFRPDLEGRPVIVLSSNDGCAVSRSDEAKALGVPMGAPAFKYRELFARHHVAQFSANFELYGNISRRITTLLTSITPRTEIYSVDESFLDLSELPISDYEAWGREVRKHILDWVGIPVSIGIAPTKTLAKLANLQAKKNPELGGVLSFVKSRENRENSEFSQTAFDQDRATHYLSKTPIADVWGIGWRLAPQMRAEGIGTALGMAQLRPQRAQQLMGIHGRQLVAELNGIACYPLELEGKLPKSVAATRTFGEDTNNRAAIEAALATFIATASFKLRRSNQLATRLTVFITTNKHKPGYNVWRQEVRLSQPTADPGILLQEATRVCATFYRTGVAYHRAGVGLHDFVPNHTLQTDLMGNVNIRQHDQSRQRMQAFDHINNRYGKRTIRLATELMGTTWRPKYNLRSPRYVSRWSELPPIRPQQYPLCR